MILIRKEVFAIRDALELQVAPDVGVLSIILRICAFVFLVVAIGCGCIIYIF